jgi:hypothetical protein
MHGVTHPMKEEKMGFLPGVRARLKMYWEIGKSLTDGRCPNDEIQSSWRQPRMENAKTRKSENAKSR